MAKLSPRKSPNASPKPCDRKNIYPPIMPNCAVIVAAGLSRRMGFDKLSAELAGIPVLRRSVEAFLNCPEIDSLVVVCPQERFDALLPGPFPKPVIRADGGENRQDSVQNGISAVP